MRGGSVLFSARQMLKSCGVRKRRAESVSPSKVPRTLSVNVRSETGRAEM